MIKRGCCYRVYIVLQYTGLQLKVTYSTWIMAACKSLWIKTVSGEIAQKVEARTICAVCLEQYTNPRTLPCHHSFCKDCIDRLPVTVEEERTTLSCPKCREIILVTDAGFPQAFEINNYLDLVELVKQMRKRKAKAKISDIMMCLEHNKPENIYCQSCDKLICLSCTASTHALQTRLWVNW